MVLNSIIPLGLLRHLSYSRGSYPHAKGTPPGQCIPLVVVHTSTANSSYCSISGHVSHSAYSFNPGIHVPELWNAPRSETFVWNRTKCGLRGTVCSVRTRSENTTVKNIWNTCSTLQVLWALGFKPVFFESDIPPVCLRQRFNFKLREVCAGKRDVACV
jgi:hypothetical protein